MSSPKLTVNIHFIRSCNYCCKFCFHRGCDDERTLNLEQWKKVIDNIAASKKVKRINFAGGEPFMAAKLLIALIKYAKEKGLETSVITNGELFSDKLFTQVADSLDMIGISCDSGSDEINMLIGRHNRYDEENLNKPHCYHVRRIAALCKQHKKFFKINSVICRENLNDDSIFELIDEIKPDRWKVFRVLKIENENGVDKDLREPYTGFLSDQEWEDWKKRCSEKCSIKPVDEDNEDMQNSYIPIDEEGYLLDSSSGSKMRKFNMLQDDFGESITQVGFDEEKFLERGGLFKIEKNNFPDIEDIALSSIGASK